MLKILNIIDIKFALEGIKIIRKFMAAHLRTVATADWKGYQYRLGDEKIFNLEEALKLYVDHIDFHRKLIDRNIEAFGKL